MCSPCSGFLNDPYGRIFKDVNEASFINFTFTTTVTSICTFFVQDSSGTLTTSLVVTNPTISGNVVQTYVSGGLDAVDYRLVFIVCDATSTVRERLAYVIVRDQLKFTGLGPNWQNPPLP